MLGVIVDTIENNIHTDVMFRELNKISKTEQCFLFTNSTRSMPRKNKFTILQQVEALCHKGTLIATSLLNAQIAKKSLTATNKFIYMHDFDWMNFNAFYASQLQEIILDEEINILSRSNTHYDIMKKLFKEPKGIVYNWRADEILKVI